MHHLIHVDGLVVDTTTGEILGYDGKPSVYATPHDYVPGITNFRSVDDLGRHLDFIDLRKLPPHTMHRLVNLQDYRQGLWHRTGLDCRITAPMMSLLRILHPLVKYRNIIIMTQTDLAKALGTVQSNLMKKLNILIGTNMMRVHTSRHGDMRNGEIKLIIHPELIFRGDDAKRDHAVNVWYSDWMNLHPQSASSINKRGLDDSTIDTIAMAA